MYSNLFLIGCVKGGTTWLYDVLKTSPGIFAPELKEPHFFSGFRQQRRHIKHINDFAEYERIYSNKDESWVIDGSATYLYVKGTAAKIKRYNPDAKIIIMLRHPVKRAYSHYLMSVREGVARLGFNDFFSEDSVQYTDINTSPCYVEMGFYYSQVSEYLDAFGDDVLIISYGELVKSNHDVVKMVCDFIDLDFSKLIFPGSRSNAAAQPKNNIFKFVLASDALRRLIQIIIPRNIRARVKGKLLKPVTTKISKETVAKLYTKCYQKDSEKLFELIGRRLWDEYDDI